jgi:hypothetical protein
MDQEMSRTLQTDGATERGSCKASKECKVCGSRSELFDNAEILGKYGIEYFRCNECGLIETEDPYWLSEAYADAISESDIGLPCRNIDLSHRTALVLQLFFGGSRTFVDYGGGYGLFVRLMRDKGFNFFRYDKYCVNLFAKGFDVSPGDASTGKFDLLTAFEVFEHLASPSEELATMLALSSNILFTTCVIRKNDPPRPGDWWYYSLSNGQHVTLYTVESLRHLAEANNLRLYSVGDFHFFTKKRIAGSLFQLLFRLRAARLVRLVMPRKRSLLSDDFRRLTGQTLTYSIYERLTRKLRRWRSRFKQLA